MKTGLFKDVSEAEYRLTKKTHISASGMKHLLKSPAHYQAYINEPEEGSAAKNFGRAFHSLVLEPEKFSESVAIAPDVNKRTNEGKAAWADFQLLNKDKTIISQGEMEEARAMAATIGRHAGANICLTGKGFAEVTCFWDEDGVPARCRFDWMREDGLLVDIKTTQDASPEGFGKSAYNYGYHMQAYWYMRAYERATGKRAEGFVFICVEKDAPHCVATYYASEEMLRLGKIDAERALEVYRRSSESGIWHGYAESLEPLHLPRWAENRLS